jgi:glyoxylase-like metal-dependent hydrolase (beta-lactamase superfamily II)
MTRGLVTLLLALFCGTSARAAEPTAIVPGVDLLPGRFVPDELPDGNTVIFRAPQGLIVVDTGRHAEHAQGILDFASATHTPIKAVINSHWHLDHIGGNLALRRAYPDVRIYASNALAGALKDFLAKYRAALEEQARTAPSPDVARLRRDEIAIIDAGPALGPDEVVRTSGERTIAGRKLALELETRAVTAGDVWVFDPATRVLAAGDLVTLPVPLLDTACPERWKAALDHLAQTDFEILVPGHGAAMHRKELEIYIRAFGRLLACSASKRPKDDCIDGWLGDAAPLLVHDAPAFTRSLLDYYIDHRLRVDPAKTAKLCAP